MSAQNSPSLETVRETVASSGGHQHAESNDEKTSRFNSSSFDASFQCRRSEGHRTVTEDRSTIRLVVVTAAPPSVLFRPSKWQKRSARSRNRNRKNSKSNKKSKPPPPKSPFPNQHPPPSPPPPPPLPHHSGTHPPPTPTQAPTPTSPSAHCYAKSGAHHHLQRSIPTTSSVLYMRIVLRLSRIG
jgi:hypothetical protein